MNLKDLFATRRSRFWGGILPYLGYVIQSGVAVVFLFLLIAFSAWYTSVVQNIPEGLPIRWIMLIVLLPLAVGSSVRTYLQPADIVFLIPQEPRMQHYFAKARVSGVIYKLIGLMLILLILWPLYIRSDAEPKGLLAAAAVLAGLKLLSSWGSWREQFMVNRTAAAGYRILRWAVILLSLASWWWYEELSSLIFIVLISAAYVISVRVPVRHLVPWERLIQVEGRQASRVMMVLSWFVNVPQQNQRIYARRWLSRWGSGLAWRPDTAYRYLLIKTFVRSDIFGMLIRVAVLGGLLVWLSRDSLAGSAVYLVALMIAGLQISSLHKMHQESFWLHVYPLPEGTRQANAVKLIFQVQLVYAVLLWLPMLPSLGSDSARVLGTGAAGFILVMIFRYNASKKKRSIDDDDDE